MNDQATTLRRLTDEAKKKSTRFSCSFFVVTGGKGGVGKTTVSLNLALSLHAAGKKVLLADLDLGLANLDVMLRWFPSATLKDFLQGEKTIAECIQELPQGIAFLPSSNGVEELASLSPSEREQILNGLASVSSRYDVILADTAAGIAPDVLGFAGVADRVILVTNPEPAALTDAYSLLKLLRQRSPKLNISFLINGALTSEETLRARERFEVVSQRFLQFRPEYLGWIPRDSAIPRASREQRPLIEAYPDCLAAGSLRHIAQVLIRGV